MNEELQQKLEKRYPQFFNKRQSTGMQMLGIECGDGWYELIDSLCNTLSRMTLHEDFGFTQIKEKFGALRIYVTESNDEVNDLLEHAEVASMGICENCGSSEEVTTEGKSWIKTMCSKCKP